MWNSPRFCFNSYLELDRTVRMRARCAGWQLWVSEKFSLLSVVNTKPFYIHNTPKTQFRADTTNRTDVSELVFPVAHKYFPEELRVCINKAQGPQCLPLRRGAVSSPPVNRALFSPLSEPLWATNTQFVWRQWSVCTGWLLTVEVKTVWSVKSPEVTFSNPKTTRLHCYHVIWSDIVCF